MAVSLSVTVSATPSDVTINGEPPAGATRPPFTLASVELPEFVFRSTFQNDTDDVAGRSLKAAALDAGTLPLVVNVHGTSMADLQANRRVLEGLFSQFTYTVTLGLGSEEETYTAFPCWPRWAIDVNQRIATATLTVTVNPMGV